MADHALPCTFHKFSLFQRREKTRKEKKKKEKERSFTNYACKIDDARAIHRKAGLSVERTEGQGGEGERGERSGGKFGILEDREARARTGMQAEISYGEEFPLASPTVRYGSMDR